MDEEVDQYHMRHLIQEAYYHRKEWSHVFRDMRPQATTFLSPQAILDSISNPFRFWLFQSPVHRRFTSLITTSQAS
jgi:hypothetical protein